MEKNKKERQERELRNSLKPHSALAPHLLRPSPTAPLLAKTYPHILHLNSLRILTLIEITYLLEIYLDLIEVSPPISRKPIQPSSRSSASASSEEGSPPDCCSTPCSRSPRVLIS